MKQFASMSLAVVALILPRSQAVKVDWIDMDAEKVEDSMEVSLGSSDQALMQLGSDPIYPSSGLQKLKDISKPTEEETLEADLSSRKPQTFTNDKVEVDDTSKSIAWAEKLVGKKLVLPRKSPAEAKISRLPHPEKDFNPFEDDDEIKDTLKSAHQAEWLYGFHGYGPGNYTGGQFCEGYGNYTNQVGYGNGSFPAYNPWTGTLG